MNIIKTFLDGLILGLMTLFSAEFWLKSKLSYFDWIGIVLIVSSEMSLWPMVGCLFLLGILSSTLRKICNIRED